MKRKLKASDIFAPKGSKLSNGTTMASVRKTIRYSELNRKEKWTKSEALKMMLYCVSTLKIMPSKRKILKAKNAMLKHKQL